MSDRDTCLRCGDPGHWSRDCQNPRRGRTPAAQPPAAPPADAGSAVNRVRFVTDPEGVKRLSVDIPDYRPAPVADAHSWANRIREADPRMGLPHCGDDGDVSKTEFRRTSGFAPAHECRLRALAAEQAAEARDTRNTTPTERTDAA